MGLEFRIWLCLLRDRQVGFRVLRFMKFSSYKIKSHSLGDILREKREEKKITLSEAERELKIGKTYLKSLEEGDYQNLPNIIYARKFLERYANFLGLPAQDLINKFNQEASSLFNKPILPKEKPKLKKIGLPHILFIIIGVILLVYLLSGVLSLFRPPFLEIYSPLNNQIIDESFVILEGRTEEGVGLYINDHLISDFIGPEFKEQLNIEEGLNTIKISAKKKYSRPATITLTLLKKSQSSLTDE